ncbi:1-(5-phosphoribosyl)-5-[(5-phosphoribosylamino)methylideneamino]imidazole-4-carboxamide isomerase [Methanolobus halotolerans]|uniref:1-(5-phosphoribosyl)-5-[(5-phosphoribosylamino)methylideneamino] imidazole-4-carboxamide isomerase n=1 Tax=Methanolobus halotolerans TaxID=2052935 RepID=A0A4E0Q3T2_9EURY|nr:1-(5-phosphoribosyl)-5-[(5-phosphoribosylamino)methylideneamino]imidazole-4-carboxamide isomerase [Methanolobus halotolerans]TGC08168.1 1-(5-phosphoribosyl)-5-[(5-phosphoribosylamino)methylideneamino]imidazole-4-carboxamide isomerase [Methanolobus halotolerans]
MTFEVIPAVDMRNGKCVQLVQGIPGSEMISLDDPVAVAKDWISQGARTLHLIDLDGAIEGKRQNAPLIERIVKECKPIGAEIQVGGGIRSFKDAADLLERGADRVILSTAAIKNPDIVKELADSFGSKHVNVALDSRDGKVSIEGWKKQSEHTAVEMGIKFENLGAGSLLFTNIDTEGLMQGVNTRPTEELVNSVNIPVIASGGVTSLDDLISIRNTGAVAVVVGSALYTGKFTLTEAINTIIQEL